MVEGRLHNSAVTFCNNIYLLGGHNGDYVSLNFDPNYLNTVEMFITVEEQFTSIKSMGFPRFHFSATISGEKIYCFRGYRNYFLDSVESFNLVTKEWKREINLPQKVVGLAAVTIFES